MWLMTESMEHWCRQSSSSRSIVPRVSLAVSGLLREAGINQVELALEGDEVTFRRDERDVLTRSVADRITVRDREGSGPFKANKELLVLGNDPPVLVVRRSPSRLSGRGVSKEARSPQSSHETQKNAVLTCHVAPTRSACCSPQAPTPPAFTKTSTTPNDTRTP